MIGRTIDGKENILLRTNEQYRNRLQSLSSRVYAFKESFCFPKSFAIIASASLFFEHCLVRISTTFMARAVVDDKYSRQLLATKPERQVEDRKVGHCTRELHTVQSG